ncbi:hypothetical protein EZ449_10795 [Pedobacter frigidisoli]|uniref:Uncharacterized protein n=1 Tax=Pedobacter frigidisoli TaxID=2530455 RepID=A0A4R0P737_9SPHI|nr:hypothetical protein [Pedobacter frigidisoli]TCD10299.1 hypothetical protein EZ449_10795 [Pedobacter frigidisoli]
MTVISLQDEDKLPIKQVIDAIDKTMDDVLRVVDAMNLGRTEVKADGVYRTFNNGETIKISSGSFAKKRVNNKRIKLF